MTHHHTDTVDHGKGTSLPYVLGYILSLILTLASYFLVVEHFLTGWVVDFAIISLGILQVMAQLVFFLHLGDEPSPYWNFQIFIFMAIVVVIVMGGSLWIMWNLDYRVMPQMDYMPTEHVQSPLSQN